MKKNIISKILIIVLIAFIIVVTIFKFSSKKEETKEHYFVSSEIKEFKTNDETEVNDLEKYNKSIIKDNLYMIEFDFFHEKESISGYIYIDKNKMLYIYDENNNINYQVSSIKFKTMYTKDYEFIDGVYVYLIGEEGSVYILSLESNDVRKAYLNKYRYGVKFTNFVEINLKNDMFENGNTLFVISDDGKIYDVNTGLRYDERTISLYNKIYVYHDKTMTNEMGHFISNNKGELYKIKYIFSTTGNSQMFKDFTPIIMVTENNEFLYFDKEMMYVYEFDKKVKDVKFDQYYPYVDGKLNITFEDDYKVDFTARCNEYYCINEFAE